MAINLRPIKGSNQFTPVAKPVDTYHRPTPREVAKPVMRTDLERLAQSLQRFSASLGSIAGSSKQEEDKQAKIDAMQAAYGIKEDDIVDVINGKKPAPENVRKALLDASLGEQMALQQAEDVNRRWEGENTAPDGLPSNAFDRDTGDVNEWYNEIIKEGLESIDPGNYEAKETYLRIMEQQRGKLNTKQKGYQEHRYQQQARSQAFLTFQGVVDVAAANEDGSIKNVKDVHKKLREQYGPLKSQYHLSNEELDEVMFHAAEMFAQEGKAGLVKEILMGDRGGVGPLSGKGAYGKRSVALIERAENKRREIIKQVQHESITYLEDQANNGSMGESELDEFTSKYPDVLSKDKVQQLKNTNASMRAKFDKELADMEQKIALKRSYDEQESKLDDQLSQIGEKGTINKIPETLVGVDEAGKEKTYSGDQLRERMINNYIEKSETHAQQKQETPEQKITREIEWFSKNGLVNPQWERILNSGFTAANSASVTSDEVPPNLTEAIAIYNELDTKSPGLLKEHMKDQSARDFYDLYNVAKNLGHNDERQSLVLATTVLRDMNDPDTKHTHQRVSEKEVREGISSDVGRGWAFWRPYPTNVGAVEKDVKRLANLYAGMGVSNADAVKHAKERVLKDYTKINGSYVKTGDLRIQTFKNMVAREGGSLVEAKDFKGAVENYLEKYAEGSDLDASDLTIRAANSAGDTFIVIGKTIPVPPISKSKLSPEITLRDLAKFEAKDIKDRADQAAKDAISGEAERKQRMLDKVEMLTGID